MRRPARTEIILVHAAGLALTIYTIVRAGDRPQVLLYAFILDYALRLVTIQLLTRRAAPLAPFFSSPPGPADASTPLRHERSGIAAGGPTYAMVMAFLASVGFVLANVNQHHAIDVDAATLATDAAAALKLAAIYWVEGLLSRTTVLVLNAPLDVNLGYNTREIVVLAFAVLAAGGVVIVRQSRGLGSSGWALLAPLLAFRTLYDLSAALRSPNNRSVSRENSTHSP
jgi:hypothetical protein